MVTARYFLNSHSAFRAIRKVTSYKPIAHFLSQNIFTGLSYMLRPSYLALATELEVAMNTSKLLGLVFIALCDFITLGVRTISLV